MGADTSPSARRGIQQTDYRALHTGRPTRQRRARATSVSDLPSDSTLDDVVGLLNVIVTQNDRLTERNEELAEQVARNEEEIRRLRSALEMSEETQAKVEERIGKMEKQMAALVESMRRNLSSQSQINATTREPSDRLSTRMMPPAIELVLTNANVDNASPGDIRARLQTALESQEATKEVKCCGITRNPSEAAKVRIFFRTEEDEELVRSNLGWLETAFRGARIRGRQWHPVKVDNVNKLAVLNDDRTTVRADACEKIGTENEVEVTSAAEEKKEPNCFRESGGETIAAPVTHSYWKQLLPTTSRQSRYPVRSMLWIRKDTQARQIAVPSSDITAAVITLRDRTIFVAAVYVAKKENVDDPELTSVLEHLRAAIIQELEAQYTFRSANWEAVRSGMRKKLIEEPPPDQAGL
ncbi:UcrQ [Macrophomina phaseolina MS6]|uniref:UcrQ n=1 Tax=Macrophomina phaseolina (strain MS6) TaxID=1126212 RepID=K2QI51_MACPH|nr:UcrQ [Macrophomina phaseolina MS6]